MRGQGLPTNFGPGGRACCPYSGPVSMPQPVATSRQFGNQTLARGLQALVAVVNAPGGMTVQEMAAALGVHRSIAYRTLQTLVDHGFLSHRGDGVYLGGPRLASLSSAYLPRLRTFALPVMRDLADAVGASITLFVIEGGSAVAIEMAEPTTAVHHISFRKGMVTPLDRGAAAYALLAGGPPQPDEPDEVTRARERGYALSAGEVEDGAYAVAVHIPGTSPSACLNLITHLSHKAETSAPQLKEAAAAIAARLV